MSNHQPRSHLHLDINDAYQILGLKPGASQAEVKQAYRQLVKTWHPDRVADQKQKQQAEEKIKKINVAYNLLKSQQLPNTAETPETPESPPSKATQVSVKRWDAETFYHLGVENASQGRYQEAIADFTRAIHLNPRYIEAYKYRGLACSQLGYEYRASSDLNKAAQLEEDLIGPKTTIRYSSRRVSQPRPLIKRWCQKIKNFLKLNLSWR